MRDIDGTICAPATAAGGALAVIRVSGNEALKCVEAIFRPAKEGLPLSSTPGYSLRYGTIVSGSETIDEVVLAVFRAPASYTGEDCVEISCHGSSYIVSRILELLTANGARMAEPGEFTRRAFTFGKMDLAQAEAVADIIASSTAAQHRVAMNQLRGGYSAELREIRKPLLELASLLELELDFSEEEVEFADRSRLKALLDEVERRCRILADSFRAGNALRNGVPVAIVGAPNSGKSTLLNALLKDDRAIVSDIPGTTRDTVEEVCMIDGIPFRFIDTAGIREASDEVERLGIERTYKKISEAEIVLGVLDAPALSPALFEREAAAIEARLPQHAKLILLANKSDISDSKYGKSLSISAKTGEGLDALRKLLVEYSGIASAEGILVTNARHAAALHSAAESLSNVRKGLDSGIPGDLLAEDLREALRHLGTITGEITTDDILKEIFGNFCIGK
ncbi:MAG: tRNA uridine-5-carboxymethylaminomethyl(34) synthesis GTPase MnmE [Bacteroidales bacterium]|nr:tRNA uridine-5-carboxymethylaminomethyl(34) synthesis GTPase MnmE [Bacteroidales bacterium]